MAAGLSLPALRVFEAASRAGSFRAAAAELALTPSAVSHAIRKLERDLGTDLFRRDGRAVVPTAAGRTLMAHVERGFAELWRGVREVSARRPGLLRVHAAPSFAAQFLAPRLPDFLRTVPGAEIRLASDTEYGRFDLCDADIVYGPAPVYGQALPLGEEVVRPLCAPALASRLHGLDDLLAATLIRSDNKQVQWEAWLAANGRAGALEAAALRGPSFDRSFLAIAAAVDGVGVALESCRLAAREIAQGKLVAPLAGVARDVRYCGHWLVVPRAERHSALLTSFTAWLLQALDVQGAGSAPPAGDHVEP